MKEPSPSTKKILTTKTKSPEVLSGEELLQSQSTLVQYAANKEIQVEPANSSLANFSSSANLPILGAVAAIAIVIISLLWRQYQKYFGNGSLQPQVNSGYQTDSRNWDYETWSSDRSEPILQDGKGKTLIGDANKDREITQIQLQKNQTIFSSKIANQKIINQKSTNQESIKTASIITKEIDQRDFKKEHPSQSQTKNSNLIAQDAAKIEPVKPDFLVWSERAITLANNGEFSGAVASFDKALRLKPNYAQAWSSRGIVLISLGKYKKAVSSFDKAIKFKADYALAWNGRGLALAGLGQYQEALFSHNQALEVEPKDAEAWNNRGSALFNLGRLEESIASYEQALEIQPEKDSAWCNRGFALAGLGKLEEAISSYIKAIRIKPNHHAAQYKLACAYAQQRSLEPALANLAHAIALEAKYLEMAKIDSDFDQIREHSQFQTLLNSKTN